MNITNITINNYNVEENSKQLPVENKKEDDNLDNELEKIGVWQASLCAAVALIRMVAMWSLLSVIFIASPTDFICTTRDNSSEPIEKCACYNDCVQYEFNNSVFDKTIISTFELVCEDAWLVDFSQTVLMFGVLVGFMLYIWLADRHGRRNALQLAGFQNISLMVVAMYSINIWVFIFIRFLIGVTSGGILVVSFIYISETVENKFRSTIFSLAILMDGVAQVFLVPFAYLSSTWDIFLMEYWGVCLIIFIAVLLMPETPIYMMSHGKIENVVILFNRIAKWNKHSTSNIEEIVVKRVEAMKLNRVIECENPRYYIDLFKDKELCFRTINMFMIFTISGCSYFGINQYTVYLGTNIYLAVAIMGFIQILACIPSICFIKLLERRITTTSLFVVASTSMVILSFVSDGHWSAIIFNAIAFISFSTMLPVMLVYTTELFPVPLQRLSFRILSVGFLVGGMIAPFVASLKPQWLPSLIFAVLTFMAALLSVLLPETVVMDLKSV